MNEAISLFREYRPVAGSIFCADPVLPPAVQPSNRAGFPVPFRITPSINRRSVAAVSGRITRLGSPGVSAAGGGTTWSPRRTSATTRGRKSKPPFAMAETAQMS